MSIFTDARRTLFLWRAGTIKSDSRPQYLEAPIGLIKLATGTNGALEEMVYTVGMGDSRGLDDMVSKDFDFRDWLGRGGMGALIERVELDEDIAWGSGTGSDFGDVKKLHFVGWI